MEINYEMKSDEVIISCTFEEDFKEYLVCHHISETAPLEILQYHYKRFLKQRDSEICE